MAILAKFSVKHFGTPKFKSEIWCMCKLHFLVQLTIYWPSFTWKKSSPTVSWTSRDSLDKSSWLVTSWTWLSEFIFQKFAGPYIRHCQQITHVTKVSSLNRSKSQVQVSTSSPLHVILVGTGNKNFLLVTSCYGRELSILDKMRTAGRIFFSHFAKILMTVGNKSFVGKGLWLAGFGHFWQIGKDSPVPPIIENPSWLISLYYNISK